MLKELLGNLKNKAGNILAPQPSEALKAFNTNVLKGKDLRIPVNAENQILDFQSYGIKKRTETERIRILDGNREESFLITRLPNGEISVKPEGFFPRAD